MYHTRPIITKRVAAAVSSRVFGGLASALDGKSSLQILAHLTALHHTQLLKFAIREGEASSWSGDRSKTLATSMATQLKPTSPAPINMASEVPVQLAP